jgi:hypothetical protein
LRVGNVQLAKLPEAGVPRTGVTSVGLVERTTSPVPVLVVTPVPPDVTANVDDKPAAVPVVFWFNVGNVQLARLPLDGVPKTGVTRVGLVDNTTLPEPVLVVTPVPPRATASVPELMLVALVVSVVAEAARPEISDADGWADETLPSVPICVRNLLVSEAFD